MKKFSGYYPLLKREEISSNILKFTFAVGDISRSARPGQFIQVRTSEDYFPLWPRPFSIYDVDVERRELVIIFKIFGCGTSRLAGKLEGQIIHILGPLGNGFPPPKNGNRVIMAGGGVGLPPLYFLAKSLIQNGHSAEKFTFISGAKTKSDLFHDQELKELNTDLAICTDDGSAGAKGTVVDLLEKELGKDPDRIVYACGPTYMLKKIDRILIEMGIPGFLSLEELMPCGYGVCGGCAVKVFPPDDRGPTDDNRLYQLKRVCADGPVFKSGVVIWE